MSEDSDEILRVREAYRLTTYTNLADREREALMQALQVARSICPSGPIVYAAKLLGISRSRLRRKMTKFHIPG